VRGILPETQSGCGAAIEFVPVGEQYQTVGRVGFIGKKYQAHGLVIDLEETGVLYESFEKIQSA
jgi:hypothetical protein